MTTELIKSKSRKAAIANGLKGHDKTGTGKRSKIRFAVPTVIGGGKPVESSSGLRGKIIAYDSSYQARQALVNYYKAQGYVQRANNEMYKPDQPVIVLPKKSKMIRLKQGKAGRAISTDGRGGIIL